MTVKEYAVFILSMLGCCVMALWDAVKEIADIVRFTIEGIRETRG